MADCKHECCGAAEKVWFQIRLIAKELERIQDFDSDNVYSMTRSEQEKLFIDAVKKHSKVEEDTIRAFL